MGNFITDAFDTGGSKTKSGAQSKTAEQKTLLKDFIELISPRLGAGANIFPGDRVSPFSTLQETALGGVGNFADLFSAPQSFETPLRGETQTALTGALAGTSGATPFTREDTSRFFEETVRKPTLKGLREDVNPAIDEAFAGPGFFGAARSQQRSKAAQDVGAQLSSQQAQLEFDVLGRNQQLEEAAANRSLAAVPQAVSFSQLPAQDQANRLKLASDQLGGLGQIFGFGAAQQSQAQAELQDDIVRFAEEHSLTDPEDLAIIMALLGLNFSSSFSKGESREAGIGVGVAKGAFSAVSAGVGSAIG